MFMFMFIVGELSSTPFIANCWVYNSFQQGISSLWRGESDERDDDDDDDDDIDDDESRAFNRSRRV